MIFFHIQDTDISDYFCHKRCTTSYSPRFPPSWLPYDPEAWREFFLHRFQSLCWFERRWCHGAYQLSESACPQIWHLLIIYLKLLVILPAESVCIETALTSAQQSRFISELADQTSQFWQMVSTFRRSHWNRFTRTRTVEAIFIFGCHMQLFSSVGSLKVCWLVTGRAIFSPFNKFNRVSDEIALPFTMGSD